MDKVFFTYLVPIDESLGLLDKIELKEKEKRKIHDVIHSMYEHKIVEVILSNLDKTHHESFVRMIAQNPYDLEIMSYLKSYNSEIDSLIQDAGKVLHQEIIALLII